jgi:hypothetical protein
MGNRQLVHFLSSQPACQRNTKMAPQKETPNLVDEAVSETSPHILLHPLVLVSQDDHATRSNIRNKGPIIGVILGQHRGKEITMEVAFECGSHQLVLENGGILLGLSWLPEMLKMCLCFTSCFETVD